MSRLIYTVVDLIIKSCAKPHQSEIDIWLNKNCATLGVIYLVWIKSFGVSDWIETDKSWKLKLKKWFDGLIGSVFYLLRYYQPKIKLIFYPQFKCFNCLGKTWGDYTKSNVKTAIVTLYLWQDTTIMSFFFQP